MLFAMKGLGRKKTSHSILVINYLQESFSCLTQEYICKHNSSCLENKSLSFFPTFDFLMNAYFY